MAVEGGKALGEDSPQEDVTRHMGPLDGRSGEPEEAARPLSATSTERDVLLQIIRLQESEIARLGEAGLV